MIIRTKIVATVGPASGETKVLSELARAGCDVFRINFSHGDADSREAYLRNIRQVEQDIGRPLAVMADLCGPKIRVGMMAGGSALLAEGQELVIQREPIEGLTGRICTTLPELVDEVAKGDTILLDDGKIRMEVIETCPPDELRCRVVLGGVLSSGKGVNVPDTHLTLSAMTEKDRRDAEWIADRDFDYVALSFVRSADDVQALRDVLDATGSAAHIVAKIEKPQAVARIEEIIAVADVIMVARGDLGVEMDLPAVPVAQKKIAHLCQKHGKPCIIATQMLETMTDSATPTRAEVSDVANAVLDHADAVMLSGETAVGKYPVGAVRMMNAIAEKVQAYDDETTSVTRVTYAPEPTTAAVAAAVREIIALEGISAVAVYTLTGTTALMLAKNRLPCPILALSHDPSALRRVCLYYGVIARQAAVPTHTRDVLAIAADFARTQNLAKEGDKIILLAGRPIHKPGKTNTLVVHTIGQEQA